MYTKDKHTLTIKQIYKIICKEVNRLIYTDFTISIKLVNRFDTYKYFIVNIDYFTDHFANITITTPDDLSILYEKIADALEFIKSKS